MPQRVLSPRPPLWKEKKIEASLDEFLNTPLPATHECSQKILAQWVQPFAIRNIYKCTNVLFLNIYIDNFILK